MSAIKIKLIRRRFADKFVNKTCPNVIWNRFDVRYDNKARVLYVIEDDNAYVIQFYINNHTCYLGVFMMPISADVFNTVLRFIKRRFPSVYGFNIWQSLNNHAGLRPAPHWLLELPETWDEYNASFTSKSRNNRRNAKLKLESDFSDIKYEYYDADNFSDELANEFLRLKNQNKNFDHVYYASAQSIRNKFYSISDVFVMRHGTKIIAMITYSRIGNSVDCWCDNMAYDVDYIKYGIGTILYYHSIEQLIASGVRNIYLGGGEYAYKQNCHARRDETYIGEFRNMNLISYINWLLLHIFSIQTKYDYIVRTKRRYVYLFGLRMRFPKRPI